MKKAIKKFFKNKLNIALFVFQAVAILFLCLLNVWKYSIVIMLVSEGVFFILFGIRNFCKNKILDSNLEMAEKIGIEEIDLEKEAKKNKIQKKMNVSYGILYFMMGLILIGIAIF